MWLQLRRKKILPTVPYCRLSSCIHSYLLNTVQKLRMLRILFKSSKNYPCILLAPLVDWSYFHFLLSDCLDKIPYTCINSDLKAWKCPTTPIQLKKNYDNILSCKAGVWGLIGSKAFCLHQLNFILLKIKKNTGLTRQWNLKLIMISILKRFIFKVRKNTMNRNITTTKEYLCRITVHFYRGGSRKYVFFRYCTLVCTF